MTLLLCMQYGHVGSEPSPLDYVRIFRAYSDALEEASPWDCYRIFRNSRYVRGKQLAAVRTKVLAKLRANLAKADSATVALLTRQLVRHRHYDINLLADIGEHVAT